MKPEEPAAGGDRRQEPARKATFPARETRSPGSSSALVVLLVRRSIRPGSPRAAPPPFYRWRRSINAATEIVPGPRRRGDASRPTQHRVSGRPGRSCFEKPPDDGRHPREWQLPRRQQERKAWLREPSSKLLRRAGTSSIRRRGRVPYAHHPTSPTPPIIVSRSRADPGAASAVAPGAASASRRLRRPSPPGSPASRSWSRRPLTSTFRPRSGSTCPCAAAGPRVGARRWPRTAQPGRRRRGGGPFLPVAPRRRHGHAAGCGPADARHGGRPDRPTSSTGRRWPTADEIGGQASAFQRDDRVPTRRTERIMRNDPRDAWPRTSRPKPAPRRSSRRFPGYDLGAR
jgi:hypothetical protein